MPDIANAVNECGRVEGIVVGPRLQPHRPRISWGAHRTDYPGHLARIGDDCVLPARLLRLRPSHVAVSRNALIAGLPPMAPSAFLHVILVRRSAAWEHAIGQKQRVILVVIAPVFGRLSN